MFNWVRPQQPQEQCWPVLPVCHCMWCVSADQSYQCMWCSRVYLSWNSEDNKCGHWAYIFWIDCGPFQKCSGTHLLLELTSPHTSCNSRLGSCDCWSRGCEGRCVKDTVWRTLSKTPLSALNSLYHEVLASCWCNSVYNETLIRWDDHCLHIYLINIIRSWHAIQSELDLNNVCVYYARNDIWSSSSFDPVTDVVRV